MRPEEQERLKILSVVASLSHTCHITVRFSYLYEGCLPLDHKATITLGYHSIEIGRLMRSHRLTDHIQIPTRMTRDNMVPLD